MNTNIISRAMRWASDNKCCTLSEAKMTGIFKVTQDSTILSICAHMSNFAWC
jgi:hypothetical protein